MEVQPLDLDDVVGVRERLVDIAPVENSGPHDVRARVVVEDDIVLQGLLGVDEDGQRVVLDLDQIGSVASELPRRRADCSDRLAHVTHTAHRECVVLDIPARLDRHLEERVGVDRDLVTRDRPVDAFQLQRLRDVDGDDPGVRVRRADEVDIAHPVAPHVVEERAEALNEPLVLAAWNRLAHVAALQSRRRLVGDGRHALLPPAATTASTMFTYPVHLQILPCSAYRTSSSLGCGLRSRSAAALISIPGVQ